AINKPEFYTNYWLGISLKPNNELKELNKRSFYYLLTTKSGYSNFKNYYDRFKYKNTLLIYYYNN
ncbi:hypothetical protein QR685DRAFT_448346, partial [Neurospora intermedia]